MARKKKTTTLTEAETPSHTQVELRRRVATAALLDAIANLAPTCGPMGTPEGLRARGGMVRDLAEAATLIRPRGSVR